MPYKPKKPCAYQGCPALTHERFCDKHKPQAVRDYNRYGRDEDTKRFYNSKAWRRVAAVQIKREPFCRECMRAGRATPAEIADHIKPIKAGGARFDEGNLQSLCRACHNRKHS